MSAPNPPFTDAQSASSGADTGTAASGAQARSAGAETTADIGQAEAYIVNLKSLVDGWIHESLEGARANRRLSDRIAQNAVTADEELRKLSLQALSNCVQACNADNNQARRHADIAIDRQWNLDEVASRSVADTAALSDMLKRTFGTTEMAEIIRGVVASEMSKMGGSGSGS